LEERSGARLKGERTRAGEAFGTLKQQKMVGGECDNMQTDEVFHDFLPIMAQKLDEEDFMAELCNGFRFIADPNTYTITFASLKKNARWLGLEGMSDDDLRAMIKEGDVDGDGALNEREFCLLMIRSSPALLLEAETWLEDALERELAEFMDEAPYYI
jgi:hypothetical protein